MSVDASIDLRIVKYKTGAVISPTETLKILLSNGWRVITDNGEAFYKSLNVNGDDDISNWTIGKITLPELMKIFEEKEQRGELIGVTINWQNTLIGGGVLLYGEKEMRQKNIHTSMTFSLDSDRQLIPGIDPFEITDVNWYLTKLLPAFTLGRGNTGRFMPKTLNEQLAMKEALSNPLAGAKELKSVTMTDLRWSAKDGWVKMSKNVNGVEIHYVRNIKTGMVDDFKFK